MMAAVLVTACGHDGDGEASIRGALDRCPTIDEISATPSRVTIGGVVGVHVEASYADFGPAALAFSFGIEESPGSATLAATASEARLTCVRPGDVTVTIDVDDGACVTRGSVIVTCADASPRGLAERLP